MQVFNRNLLRILTNHPEFKPWIIFTAVGIFHDLFLYAFLYVWSASRNERDVLFLIYHSIIILDAVTVVIADYWCAIVFLEVLVKPTYTHRALIHKTTHLINMIEFVLSLLLHTFILQFLQMVKVGGFFDLVTGIWLQLVRFYHTSGKIIEITLASNTLWLHLQQLSKTARRFDARRWWFSAIMHNFRL